MANFSSLNIQPDYGISKQSNPKSREVVFGDGYIMAAKFGLNQNLKISSLMQSETPLIQDYVNFNLF